MNQSISPQERAAFESFGATVVGYEHGKNVVLKFSSVNKMLTLIDELKKASRGYKFNSKRDDEGNHLVEVTYSASRPSMYL